MIVSHAIEIGAVQKDGRLAIVERYLRDDGSEEMFCSLVASKVDLEAWAAERIAMLDAADAAPKPVADPVELKLDAARRAYDAGDYGGAKTLIADAVAAIDTKDKP